MKATKKTPKPKIKTIHIGVEPAKTVVFNGVKYQRQDNGNYKDKDGNEFTLVV